MWAIKWLITTVRRNSRLRCVRWLGRGSTAIIAMMWRMLMRMLLYGLIFPSFGSQGNVVTRTSQERFGPTTTNWIRQRSNYRWFLRRTVKQSYRVTTLVLVVWQAKEVTQWLFTDRVYQGGLSLGFWDRKSRNLCQNYAISTWETGVRNRCWSAAKEQPLGLFSLFACILSHGCFFAAAFSLCWV